MKKVVIFGTTNAARLAYWYFKYDSPFEVVSFTVDRDYVQEDSLFELPVVPFDEVESDYPPDRYSMFIAISFGRVNKLRAEKYGQARALGYELVSYVSSKAAVWPGTDIGDNCFICANAAILPFAMIGNDVSIRENCVVSHDSRIGDHCFLAAGAVVLGNATVKSYCFLGANSTIRNGITIARECVIGAGSLILGDTQEKGVYKGNPATLLPVRSDSLRRI